MEDFLFENKEEINLTHDESWFEFFVRSIYV